MATYETLGNGGYSNLVTAIFNKLKNVLGDTDISDVGDGTATGAILALYNAGLQSHSFGIISAYVTDATPFTANWLSLTAPTTDTSGSEPVTTYGTPLVPETNMIYMILSDGDYLRQLVAWNGTKYVYAGASVNLNNGVETLDYVPNTATEPGQAGLVPAAPAGTTNEVFRWDGWGETPLDITTAEIDEIFGKVIPGHSDYTTTKTAIGTFNGNTLYRQTFENLNVPVTAGGNATVLTGTAITQITRALYYTATGTYVPSETAVLNGDVTIVGSSAATIVGFSLDFIE